MKKVIIFILLLAIVGIVTFNVCFVIPLVSSVSLASQENYTVYIDPGHGGIDGGAVSRYGDYEKDINLKVSLYLRGYLEKIGIKVYMTRTTDVDLASKNAKSHKTEDILKRVKLINESDCDIYISIHTNLYPSDKISGSQTFYKQESEASSLLANHIQDMLKKVLGNTKREAKIIKGKYLIENTNKPGCLVEVGFLSNDRELELLRKDDYQEKIAYAIYLGILQNML